VKSTECIVALLLQNLLRARATTYRYTCIAYLVNYCKRWIYKSSWPG